MVGCTLYEQEQCTKHCAKTITHIICLTRNILLWFLHILMRKRRSRETEWLVQGNKASKWQSWDLNSCLHNIKIQIGHLQTFLSNWIHSWNYRSHSK